MGLRMNGYLFALWLYGLNFHLTTNEVKFQLRISSHKKKKIAKRKTSLGGTKKKYINRI
jgi:hypothetical protein